MATPATHEGSSNMATADGPPVATGSKRPRGRNRASYPRKRALIACETCRQRKTKCDNERPTCGGCAELEVECVFQSSTEYSTYDRASLEILDRINYVAGLLEGQCAQLPSGSLVPEEPQSTPSGLSAAIGPPVEVPEPGADDFLESLEFHGRTPGVCEDILEWPIFGGNFDRSQIETLIFSPSIASGKDARSGLHSHDNNYGLARSIDSTPAARVSRGVNEEHAPALVERFLINVHIKNPVLDPYQLREKARHISDNGFGWDADSCLMLVVCALSIISLDFTPEPVTPELVDGPHPITSQTDTKDYDTAEAYYTASRKRLGLLEHSISAAQCYFLTGVYEMYSVRPLRGWSSFSRACENLQIFFRGQRDPEIRDPGGLVRRLYWSCLKSECEIRMEISLPPSGLAKVAYSDAFPSPPSGTPSPNTSCQASPSFLGPQQPDLECVWSYYLSEIAVRKIGNRIMNCFYREDASAWLAMPLQRMIRIAEELENQLTQWFENIPAILFTPSSDCGNQDVQIRVTQELQFVLQARLSDFREKLYRPFLYIALHLPATDPAQVTLAPYLHRCVDACVAFMHRGTPRHRHHGTWFENRGMFLKCLLVIAVAKSDKTLLPPSWREGAELCVAGFKFWEGEAPDLRAARHVLEGLLAEVSYG